MTRLPCQIPLRDETWLRMTEADRNWVRVHMLIFVALAAADSINREAGRQAQIYRGERGFSKKAIMDKFRRFRQNGGDWRSVVPRWKNKNGALPMEFIIFFTSLVGDSKREDGARGAYRRLLHDYYAAGRPIPGYSGDWRAIWLKDHPKVPVPEACSLNPGDLPGGWSYGNLMRHLPSEARRALMRRGIAAAHRHQRHLVRDRSQLRPFELIALDDFWLDIQCWHPGNGKPQIVRPIGVLALDVATGIDLAFGLKPRLMRKDGTREGIQRAEVRELLVSLFETRGLPPYPVTLLVENAAAAISPADEEALKTMFGDRVRVDRTGVFNDVLLKNGFRERGGKPWEKGWVESFFRLLHISIAHLPGQTGSRYDNAPGDQDDAVRYTRKLLTRSGLTESDIEALRLPVLKFDQAQDAVWKALKMLQNRTDHRLQGFDSVIEWRTADGDPYRPEKALYLLDARSREEVTDIVKRPESPIERFRRLMVDVKMSPLPRGMLWPLYAAHRRVTITGKGLRFQDLAVSREPLEFWDEPCAVLEENVGRKLLAWYKPHEPDCVHLTTLEDDPSKRRYLGTVPRWKSVNIRDRSALGKAAAKVATARNRDIAAVRGFLSDADARLKRDREHNEMIVRTARARACLPDAMTALDRALDDGAGTQEEKTRKSIQNLLPDPRPASNREEPDTAEEEKLRRIRSLL